MRRTGTTTRLNNLQEVPYSFDANNFEADNFEASHDRHYFNRRGSRQHVKPVVGIGVMIMSENETITIQVLSLILVMNSDYLEILS